ncbi:MAG TPA: ATP-binding protein, partial [Chloroflexota bacterium]|nr:ATP-binding protein [Chloroflexota bacterium]
SMSIDSWLAAEKTVFSGLLGLWGGDLSYAQSVAVTAANQSLSRSVTVGSLVLVLTLAALAAAIILANSLVRRLRRLRENTMKLADDTLPSMVRRIGDGEPVDIGTEMALLDYGSDEIGQVAEAFNTAQRTAVTAAVAEARTRGGISKVFLDIAHRSQLVVHRQLELLDVAEAKQGDPEHLDLLFQLDHLATRARRNAENLLILGGGQPGRRWRQPAALEDIVRSAISETEQFARVRTIRVPDVQVQGGVVGDLIHLLAELVDNATAFSPPAAEVTVRGNIVGKGVVVEVEDQGLGIEFDQRERLNETLRNPPGFQSMALSGQRHLGLFVVGQLAQRHGITVTLLESAYGGTRAIVLISSSGLDTAAEHGGGLPAARQLGRHAPLLEAAVAAAGPAQESRATEHAPPFAVVRDAEHAASASAPWDKARAPVTGVARAGRAPLPHREPLANLAPGLRPDADAAPHSDTPARPRRSPEEARGSMSAFQRGTRLGRHSPGQGNQ